MLRPIFKQIVAWDVREQWADYTLDKDNLYLSKMKI